MARFLRNFIEKEMLIKISGLGEGVHNFTGNGKIEDYELGKPFYGNYVLNAELTKSKNQFILDVDFDAPAQFECDRCGTEINSNIKTKFSMVYILTVEPKESDDPNVVYISFDADKINFTKDVYDLVNLSVPMKRLCKEDCKGLCAGCGTDLNIEKCKCSTEIVDDRWKPLLELKNKIKN